MKLKVMTYNVQHFADFHSGRIDYSGIAGFIRSSGADIIGLNETYGENSTFDDVTQARRLADALGMSWYFSEAINIDNAPYGNSFLSRFPIIGAETIGIPDPVPPAFKGYYETRAVALLTLRPDGKDLTVAVTHFGLNPDEQKNAVDTVNDIIKDERFILMGDLNVLPDDPVLSPVRRRLNDTAVHLGERKLSFPSDKPDCRIDYIFTSKDIGVISADIPEAVLSDHRPYIAEIMI